MLAGIPAEWRADPNVDPQTLRNLGGRSGLGVIRIEEKDFKGDPSRVINHPSNPATEATQAMADAHRAQADTQPR